MPYFVFHPTAHGVKNLCADYRCLFVRAYTDIAKKHPDSNVTPGLFIRIAQCFEFDKNYKEARVLYRATILKFPKTKAASVSKLRLEVLSNP